MCLFRFLKKKNENLPHGIRIAEAAFPQNASGREPSENEKQLFSLFSKDPVRLTAEERRQRAETEQAFLAAKQALGKCPVNVGSGSAMPLALAKFLAIRGFNVRAVTAEDLYAGEKEDHAWLAVHFPDIMLVKEEDPGHAVLYLDGREPVNYNPESESLEMLAMRMAETAWSMRFFV